MKHPTVVQSDLATRLFRVEPRGAAEGIRAALRYEDREYAETRWHDSLSASGASHGPGAARFGQRLVDRRVVSVAASPGACFAAIARLGGRDGWPAFNRLWRLRGFIDLLAGGVGMRRGRPVNRPLRVGDALDFWRVETCDPPRRLRLFAEMKLPGRAWLEFVVETDGRGSRITQTAEFDPVGLLGRAYWYGVYPLHRLVFAGTLDGIAARALHDEGRGRAGMNGTAA